MAAAQTASNESRPVLKESAMKVVSFRHAAIAAALFAIATLGACADVRQEPASSVVGVSSSAAVADVPAPSPTSVPF